ncbi:MAG: peptidylprolyl isomerase [Persicimonas sp.]
MYINRCFAVLLVALLALAACERKAEKADDNGAEPAAADQAQDEDADEEGQPSETAEPAAEEQAADEQADGEPELVEAPPLDELHPAMLDPAKADEQAPEQFRAKFETTEGDFIIEFNRDWAPNGADRAYNLVKIGYFDGIAFFRVIDNFMAQFGIHAHPEVNKAWEEAAIEADTLEKSNIRGRVTFAQKANPDTGQSDPATRTTHLFINYGDNSALDDQQFVPVGEVVEGMEVVEQLYSGYGGGPPTGPDQKDAMEKGSSYLQQDFARLDSIKKAEILDE